MKICREFGLSRFQKLESLNHELKSLAFQQDCVHGTKRQTDIDLMRNCPSTAAGLTGHDTQTLTPALALRRQEKDETVTGPKTGGKVRQLKPSARHVRCT